MLWSIVSAILLILAFPKTDYWPLAFIAFIPFFLFLDKRKQTAGFLYGFLLGVVFFAGTLYWFIHVTYLGAALLVIYCALYFGLFGMAVCFVRERGSLTKLLFLPSFWVVCEFARAHLFSGFGWAALGHSQYTNLLVIQIADITGVAGVSFFVMFINVGLKELLVQLASKKSKGDALQVNIALVFVLTVVLSYGSFQLKEAEDAPQIRVAIVQGNIPQEMKWHEPYWPDIMEKYMVLTRRAALEGPQLVIWPETAFPGYLGEHDEAFALLRDFVARELDVPLLLGTVVKEGNDYFNSVVMIASDGTIEQRYDKLHLVPFGEYIPFRRFFPFLEQIVPIADFTSGQEFTLFDLPVAGDKKAAALVCFEDSVGYLARRFVGRGANLLVNVTNDAWFKDTKAPYMHLQAAVFRTVENRRELVRAANTGVSVIIDNRGRIKGRLEDKKGKPTYVAGYYLGEAALHEEKTLYVALGECFSYLCLAFVVFALGALKWNPKRPRQES